MDLQAFAGVWSRVQLFEPKSSAHACDESSIVLWLQAPSGEFVDLRWLGNLGAQPLPQNWNARLFKSFAGVGSCASVGGACHFTWTREIDFRPRGPPDVGEMSFVDEEKVLLQEDGVLEGDDYREIWRRIDGSACNSFGGRLFLPDSPDAKGFVVISGGYVGIAVRCAPTYTDGDEQPITQIFTDEGRSPSLVEQAALDNYFGLIASDERVVVCSRPIWKDQSVDVVVSCCIPGWFCEKQLHSKLPQSLQCKIPCHKS